MTWTDGGMLLLAAAFVVVTGINDGGALLSTGLRVPSVRPLSATIILVACVVVVPLFSTAVAHGIANSLVTFDDTSAHVAVVIGLISAVVVVLASTWRGLPTSLTLALVGGLTGAGIGFDLAVGWWYVIGVIAVGMSAPVAGGLLAYLLTRWIRFLPPCLRLRGAVYRSHRIAYVVQAAAYASNDAQKMLGVLAILSIAGTSLDSPNPATLLALGLIFGLGVVLGLPRVSRGLGNGVLLVRPAHAVAAEFASGAAVITSAAIGVPVSMTQSVAGGLIGAGVGHGSRRIRWREVYRICSTWVFTLPATGAFAAVVSFAWRGVS